MYEYAFSLTGIEKFKIVKSFPPRCTISPNCTLSESQIESNCVLMMDPGADENVLDFLNEDEVSGMLLMFLLIYHNISGFYS